MNNFKEALSKSKSISKYVPWLLLIIIFFFILQLNQLTPLWADDYCRMGSSLGISDAILKTIHAYSSWSGRVVTMFLTYFIMGNIPQSLIFFNMGNSIFFCLLIVAIFVLTYGRAPNQLRDGVIILLIFDLLFIGTKGIGEVALWKTGSIGYLWGVTLELTFLIPFFYT